MANKFHKFIVTGTVSNGLFFPYDMLRYDMAWPTSKGVDGLTVCLEAVINKDRTIVEVELESTREPTIDRWRSFGWGCKKVEGY